MGQRDRFTPLWQESKGGTPFTNIRSNGAAPDTLNVPLIIGPDHTPWFNATLTIQVRGQTLVQQAERVSDDRCCRRPQLFCSAVLQ